MGEMEMVVWGFVAIAVVILPIWAFAYVINSYLNKKEIIKKVKQQRECEESQKLYCPQCGKLNMKEFVYCQYCGSPLH